MHQHKYSKKVLWILLIILLSFSLVGAALAAANSASKTVTQTQAAPSYNQVGQQPGGSLTHSPMQTEADPPVASRPADMVGEQMRQQAMDASLRVENRDVRGDRTYLTDADAHKSSVSKSPSGAAIEYIPDDIVVDTDIDRFFGYTNEYGFIRFIRVNGSDYATAEADDTGYFWTQMFDGGGNGFPVDIGSGDEFVVQEDMDSYLITLGDEPQGYLDVLSDSLLGTIPNDTGGTVVTVTLGLSGQPSQAYDLYTAVTDSNGDFEVVFYDDIGPENFAMVDYKPGEFYQRTNFFPQALFLIQQHGMISGYAPRGATVYATVYVGDSSEIRWEGETVAEYPYGWFTFYYVVLDIGDRVVVDFPSGSNEMHYVYSSFFDFPDTHTLTGNTSPNSEVRVSFVQWDTGGYSYFENVVTSAANGDFTANFPGVFIRPDTNVDVAVMDPSGAGSVMSTGREYVEVIVDSVSDYDCVWGRVDVPNTNVILELERDGNIYPRDPSRPIISDPGNMAGGGMCYLVWYDFGNGLQPMNFEVGDILRLKTDTWSGERDVQEIHYGTNSDINSIDGEIIDGQLDGEIAFRVSQPFYTAFNQGTSTEARASIVDGGFYVPLDGFDVRSGVYVNTFIYDPYTWFAMHLTERNHYFNTVRNIAVQGHNYIPDEEITLNLLDPYTFEPVYTTTNDIDPDPYGFYFDFADYPQYPPLQDGTPIEVLYQYSGDVDTSLIYRYIYVNGNVEEDRIHGYGEDKLVNFTAGYDQVSFDQMAPEYSGYSVIAPSSFGYALGWGDLVELTVLNQYGNGQTATYLTGEIRRMEFWQNPNGMTGMWGTAQPGADVYIETSQGDTLTGWADPLMDGGFSMDHPVPLAPGDLLTVYAGESSYPLEVTIPDTWVRSDSSNDTVSGYIGLPNWMVEINPWWDEGMQVVETDANGYFSAIFNDVPSGGRGHMRYTQVMGAAEVHVIFHKPFYDIDPSIRVNFAHEWVEGNYDPGVQVAITVTDQTEAIKATAHGMTGPINGWGDETGFSTGNNVFWDGPNPDLQPSDQIYLSLGNGWAEEVQVGEINGALNLAADTVEGSLDIPWLTDPVPVDCGAWIENGPSLRAGEVDPNGGTFTCDFGAIGFDLLAGMDVGVWYHESDDDQVFNVLREPAPDLRINMWGQGQPAYGNNYILEVHYNNDGQVTAPGVTIQQEFWGMVYLSDTSGLPHTGTGDPGDPIVWEVGDLPINHYNESVFYVFVEVVNPPGSDLFTYAYIDSSLDYYQDENRKYSSWESEVSGASDTDLGVDMWSWTGDPTGGQDFVYVDNVCNGSSASSTEVTLTDDLPAEVTLVSWWAQQPGWEEVSTAPHQLVVKRPSLTGGTCGEVYIQVHLSEAVEPGTQLLNNACVSASSDPNPDNDCNVNETWTSGPYYNLHMYPNWVQGQFIPGGEVGYEFGFQNWGNMPMPGTSMMTTLPEGTEFLLAYTWDWSGWMPITPTVVGDGYLLWDFGTFPNGYNQNLGIRLRIGEEVQPGMELVMENVVSGSELEIRYDDNTLVYTEMVNAYGPNLRVDKHSNWGWNDWYEGDDHYQQINYELRILNLGSEFLDDPVVVDSYPISTTVNDGDCWWNHGPFTGCEVDQANHQVIFYLDYLNPGETASGMFRTNIDPEYVGVQGLAFTNVADISDFEDITPEDNHDEVTAFTGSDTFVRKWLKEGVVQAGREITYTVEFGNLNRWPWNTDPNADSHITEILPEGVSFVRAYGYWDPEHDWEPESIDGQTISWGWGPMWAESTWTFDIVVQIDNDVPPGAELLNTIEAWGDNPADIDINPSNNHFEYSLYTLMYRQMMPFILKSP